MKRRVFRVGCFLLLCFLLASGGTIVSSAAESDDTYASLQESVSALYDEIDRNTKEALEAFGVTDGDFSELSELSPRKVVSAVLAMLTGAAAQPLRSMCFLCAFMLLGALSDGFAQKTSARNVFTLFSILWILLSVLPPMTESFSNALSAVSLGADFLLAFIPIFTGVIAMSGKPLLSAAYSSVMLGMSNLLSFMNAKVLLPLTQGFTMLHVVSVLQEKHTLEPIAAFLKKCVHIILGFAATLFTGLLTLKGTLASSGDSLSVRGIKMAVGTAIPVIGGTLSEAYTSVLGSMALIRSTVGVFGILVIVLMHLPSVLELLLWYLALSCAAAIGGALGQDTAKKLLEGFAGAAALLNVFLIFNAFLLVISTGVILQFKG